jgi:hypothetical protein
MTDPKELPDIRDAVKALLMKQNKSMHMASRRMGRSHNFLSLTLRDRNPRIGLLIDLSEELGTNLLNYYLDHMPPSVRLTARDVAHREEINALKAELERVKEENAKLWGVIAGRG